MSGSVSVELADLRGYADVVDDIAGYLGKVAGHAETHCVATDFGQLLDPLTGQYVTLLPQMHSLLAEQVTRMRTSVVAIDRTLQGFIDTDAQEAARHGAQVTVTDDGRSASYYGNPMTQMSNPTPDESELPEIDFGFPFDQLAWAMEKICSYDVRREVTDYLVGDVVEVSKQSNAWYFVGSATSSYAWYLRNANVTVAKTWSGDAFEATQTRMEEWVDALEQQGVDFDQIAKHLSDIAVTQSRWPSLPLT